MTSTPSQQVHQVSKPPFVVIATIAAIVLTGAAVVSAVVVWSQWPPDKASPQEISATFGPATGIFSALALAGVVLTVWMQKHQIDVQHNEIQDARGDAAEAQKASRSQLALQGEELAVAKSNGSAQAQLLAKQSFESTFFQLLRLQEEIRDSVSFDNHVGRDAIRAASQRIVNALMAFRGVEHLHVTRYYNEHLVGMTAEPLGHYFRNLYVTLRYVHDNAGTDAPLYVRILRAQLSQSELAILFYNAFGQYGAEKMLPLAKRYHLFKNLEPTRLAREEHFRWLDGVPVPQ